MKQLLLVVLLFLGGCLLPDYSQPPTAGPFASWSEAQLAERLFIRLRIDGSEVLHYVDHYSGGRYAEYYITEVSVVGPLPHEGKTLKIIHEFQPEPNSIWTSREAEFCTEVNTYAIEIPDVQVPSESLNIISCDTL